MSNTKPLETAGPEAKCCLGVTYFNRTLERNGKAPKCMGVTQIKNGDQENDDVRMLNEATGDFQYYCVGYSSHPTDLKPARPGRPTQMPFCEGVEIAITEERVPVAPAAGTGGRTLIEDSFIPSTVGQGSAARLPPAAAGPSDEDRSLQTRFQKQVLRNADCLLSAATGQKLPPLPFQFRTYDTVAEARQSFAETATVNLVKMRVWAEFITNRTMDAAKPIWERFHSEEETE